MYKRTDASVGRLWMYSTFVLGAIVIILNGVIIYSFNKPQENKTTDVSQNNTQQSNVAPEDLLVLGQTTTKPITEGAVPTEQTTISAVMQMPEGWAAGAVESKPDPCGGSETMKVSAYSKDKIVINVYEISNSKNCNPLSIQDVALNFNYQNSKKSIVIPTENIEFCTKDQNPACPKGDGKVSAYIQNIDQQSDMHVLNSLTKKAYIFEAIDSSVSANTDAQIKNMTSIIESSFKIQ